MVLADLAAGAPPLGADGGRRHVGQAAGRVTVGGWPVAVVGAWPLEPGTAAGPDVAGVCPASTACSRASVAAEDVGGVGTALGADVGPDCAVALAGAVAAVTRRPLPRHRSRRWLARPAQCPPRWRSARRVASATKKARVAGGDRGAGGSRGDPEGRSGCSRDRGGAGWRGRGRRIAAAPAAWCRGSDRRGLPQDRHQRGEGRGEPVDSAGRRG